PTIEDSKTEDGSGIGEFTSLMYPLMPSTQYWVRAYATNSVGTEYGGTKGFTTQAPSPDVIKVVAQDGSGDYETVQAAFDDVPDNYTGSWTIYVKPGTYYEKLFLDRNKINVTLKGDDPLTTILTYDDYAGKAGGTSMSYSAAIDPDDFTAVNITFQNTVVNDGSFNDQQGVALRVNGDRQAYYNCRLLGYQDTYYAWGGRATGRTYMKNCYVEGSVDFIFGRNIVLFDSCEIHINRNGGTLTAASTEPETKFGLVFSDCIISADSIGFNGTPITSFLLGRPWQQSPRTVFIRCEEPASLNPAGWSTWNVPPALYAEYQCYGPGSDHSNRINISRQLSEDEALEYTLENIFSKDSHPAFAFDWAPEEPESTITTIEKTGEAIPKTYQLFQNYPNPFNPTTSIQFALPKDGFVTLTIYNALGQQVESLVNQKLTAGFHLITLDAARFSSGVYFYRIKIGDDFQQVKKMLLMK
ncbi:T9SS type A sorting domain-containing protein, partial [candidate division KSB1 bacterium]|nr:T9SS type A sorting domain-containing protein [candidate division KSB1 bacterium]